MKIWLHSRKDKFLYTYKNVNYLVSRQINQKIKNNADVFTTYHIYEEEPSTILRTFVFYRKLFCYSISETYNHKDTAKTFREEDRYAYDIVFVLDKYLTMCKDIQDKIQFKNKNTELFKTGCNLDVVMAENKRIGTVSNYRIYCIGEVELDKFCETFYYESYTDIFMKDRYDIEQISEFITSIHCAYPLDISRFYQYKKKDKVLLIVDDVTKKCFVVK